MCFSIFCIGIVLFQVGILWFEAVGLLGQL
jgi:hypothetical protein